MKLGLALGGGGAKGIAHVGVLQVLVQAGVSIDIIAGTSAGALIGALFAGGKTPDEIGALMRRMGLRQWLARDRTGTGFFSTEGIRRAIEAELGKDIRIEDLSRPFAAVASEMESQKEVVFDSGLVADAVCASCAFPMVLAPVEIGGSHYLDGGLLNPVPFDVVRRLGANRVVAVDLHSDEPTFSANSMRSGAEAFLFRFIFSAGQQKIFRVSARAIGIMGKAARELKQMRTPPDLTILPDVLNIGLIDFDLADIAIAAGDQAMRQSLGELERILSRSLHIRWQDRWRQTERRFRRILAAAKD